MSTGTNGGMHWLRGQLAGRFLAPVPEVHDNTFVLWEPCSRSHGEIVPGYAAYLRDLGFDVLVLMTPQRLDEGLFARMDTSGIRHGGMTLRAIRRWVRGGDLRRAAGILVTTAGKLPDRSDGAVDLHKVFGPELPKRVLLVDHDARARVDRGVWSPDTITLRPLDYKGAQSVVVNPHHFGKVTQTPKAQGRTIFVAVGAVRARRGNLPLVLDGAAQLLRDGIRDFEIRVIGKPGRDPLPEELEHHVRLLGRLDFAAMYDEIEAADFLLTSFQADNPDHAFYRTGGTSGAFQLAYGFAKPIIVQRDFAHLNGFDSSNALLYGEDAGFARSLRAGIALPSDEYGALQAGMKAAADALGQQSLDNLRRLARG
ncbi:MAG: hypothetical protein ACWA5A_05375 [Marinibacterium sp.]